MKDDTTDSFMKIIQSVKQNIKNFIFFLEYLNCLYKRLRREASGKIIRFKALVLLDYSTLVEYDCRSYSVRTQSQYREDLTKLVKEVKHSIFRTHIIVQGGMGDFFLNLNDYTKRCPFFESCDCADEKECDFKELKNNEEYFKGVDFICKFLDEGLFDHLIRLHVETSAFCFAVQTVYLSEEEVRTSLDGIDIVRRMKQFATLEKNFKTIKGKSTSRILETAL